MLSSIQKLQKFFRLEVERGYDNRAVVGGLDKILPAWESEARQNQLSEDTIQAVISGLQAYPGLEPEARAEAIERLIHQLDQASPSYGAPAAAPTSEPSDHPGAPQPAELGPADEASLPPTVVPDQASSRPDGPQPARSQPAIPQPQRQGESQRAATRSAAPGRGYASGTPGLDAPLHVLSGVGNKLAQTLSELGLNTLEDLLFYFPRRYDDYSQLKPINRLAYGEETTVLGTVQSAHSRPIRGGKMQMTEAVVTDGTGSLRVTWFNQPWLANKLHKGTQVVLAGKVDQYLGRPTMSNPEMEALEAEHLHTNRIVPVYALTARLNQKSLRRIMYQTIQYWAPRVPDYLPERVRSSVKVIDLAKALLNVHFPESQDMLDVARWRLAFDEIFLLQLGVLRQKRSWQAGSAQVFDAPAEWIEQQVARLPFALTGAQQRVLQEIYTDLASGKPMERLVQGDVGSGKTVVAALAVALIARQGAQAAVMAPTSILAEQHYRSFTRLLCAEGEEGGAPLQPGEIRLLIGDTPEAEKQAIRAGLEDGSVKLVIGTHALIEAPVKFQRLQLAVIDEQHRFGVSQRAALREKGDNLHLLVMTATPIPRSLALTVYGDLDLSVMDELPPGRQPVDTHVLRPIERERAYNLIDAQIELGRQAFVIYPLVEQGDSADSLAAVEQQKRLQTEVFSRRKVGLMHGRMKPDEKDQVMGAFRNREYDVLVSTTVVEVGVDIPNATVMLIEGANRFGLAQLHQLRGRVGRGADQSFCLLIPDNEDAVENERLSVMSETNDGFVLAERDLQQRGPGEFLGTRQAGFSELKMANLTDVRLIEKARQQAQALFQDDPELAAPEHQQLAKRMQSFWSPGKGDVS